MDLDEVVFATVSINFIISLKVILNHCELIEIYLSSPQEPQNGAEIFIAEFY